MAGHTYLVFASIEYLFPDVNFLQSNLLVVDSDFWKMLKEWNKIKLENNQKQEAWVQGPKALLVRRRAFRFEIAGARAVAPARAAAAERSVKCQGLGLIRTNLNTGSWAFDWVDSSRSGPGSGRLGLPLCPARRPGGAPEPPATRWRLLNFNQ